MEQNDAIAYKAWVENLREPAPEGAWDAIADQLDIDAAWDGIHESLDLDDVWLNVEAELPHAAPVVTKPAQIHFPRFLWVAAALVLFTLTTPLPDNIPAVQEPIPGQANVKTETKVIAEPGMQTAGNNDREPKPREKKDVTAGKPAYESERIERVKSGNNKQLSSDTERAPEIIRLFNNLNMATHASDSLVKSHEKPILKGQPGNTLLAGRSQQPADSTALREEKIEMDSSVTVTAAENRKDSVQRDQPGRARWQVGLIGSLKNTWLINPETANGLKRSSLNDTRLTFGKEFGITLQRSFGGQAALQVEYYFYSEIGQRYHEYINALYQTKDVRLRYQKFQVVYRTRVWRNVDAPALYAVGGVRVSRLTLADTSIGNESQEVTQEYRPWDYGFILGGEAEFKLNNKLLLVSGLRASYGLRNIYLGTNQAPAEFNRTHTASLGLVVGLKYCMY